ncbi:MAG TPA: HAD-IA family hydrolase, partial [Spirochaetia bacterium]
WGLTRSGYDRGTLDGPAYWGAILTAGGVTPTPALVEELARLDTRSWTRVNEPVKQWARDLRAAGRRTAILSNMPFETLRCIRSNPSLRWIEEFDVAVYSCDYRLIKPEAGLYRICLEKLGATPDTCAFLDDNLENVEAARALGMSATRFESTAQVAAVAAGWGLPVDALRA